MRNYIRNKLLQKSKRSECVDAAFPEGRPYQPERSHKASGTLKARTPWKEVLVQEHAPADVNERHSSEKH
jgi:hypothetical protein